MSDNPILAVFPQRLLDELDHIEALLAEQADSTDPDLAAWNLEVVAAGGKRVRPLLLLAAFEACGGRRLGDEAVRQAYRAATSVELIHTASLVHDDIMDEAKERRGKPSTVAAHGLTGAILVGDYLFTQAFALSAALPHGAHDLVAHACRRLCQGQLHEQRLAAAGRPDRDGYRQVIRDKTAALLSAATGAGAVLARADPATVERLTRYGEAVGTAFQVLDDVLDVAGDPAWTGKPAGTDYVAGTMSSPYLHHLERGGELPPAAGRQAKDFPAVRDDLFASGAVAASQQEAGAYTQAALLDVERLPPSEARDALVRLAELLMQRVQ
ncbi:MAG: polyprenyl synthetase family protein [Thermoplasmatota archaeon]